MEGICFIQLAGAHGDLFGLDASGHVWLYEPYDEHWRPIAMTTAPTVREMWRSVEQRVKKDAGTGKQLSLKF